MPWNVYLNCVFVSNARPGFGSGEGRRELRDKTVGSEYECNDNALLCGG